MLGFRTGARAIGDRAARSLRPRAAAVALLVVSLVSAGLFTVAAPAGAASRPKTASPVGAAATPVTQPRVSIGPDMVVGEADGVVDVPVTLSAPGTNPVTVVYTTADNTASSNCSDTGDYVTIGGCVGHPAGTLTFAPGETSKSIPVTVLDDATKEGQQSFLVNLSTPTNSTIARGSTRVTIVDNDNLVATPALYVRTGITTDASAGTVTVPVLLGGTAGQASASTVTVHYTTVDGSAVAGTDYTAASNTLTFSPGQTVKNVVVTLSGSATPASARSFKIELDSPSHATIAAAVGTVTIGAHGATAITQPAISIGPDLVVGEGDGYVDVPVTLSTPGTNPVTVVYTTADNTAAANCGTAANGDYVPLSGCTWTDNDAQRTLTFAPGETTKTIRIELIDDLSVERQESFLVNLAPPSPATSGFIARASARVTIIDNDNLVATPALYVRTGITTDASAGTVTVPVLLGGTAGQASTNVVTVPFMTSDGSATAGTDYTATSGTLTFNPGQTVQNVVIPLTPSAGATPARSFSVILLAGATHATVADFTGTVTIGAHGATAITQPAISIGPDLVVGEGDGYVDVPVTLSTPGTNPVTVVYTTADNTAAANCGTAANGDYVPLSGCTWTDNDAQRTLTFAPGETTKTIRIELIDDLSIERQESFLVNLAPPSPATSGFIARASARVTIIDNDNLVATPALYVRTGITTDASAGTVTVPVLLGGTAGQASGSLVTVNYSTADGSATAGTDYIANGGTLFFNPGETVENVVIRLTPSAGATPTRSFRLTLSSPTNSTLGRPTGTVTIGAHGATAVPSPTISSGPDVSMGENDGYVDVPVTLSAPGTNPVTVVYTSADITAAANCGTAANGDYVPLSGCTWTNSVAERTLTFAPGQTTKTVRIEIINDLVPEPTEAFTLNLSSPSGATIARATTTITIADDDSLAASTSTVTATPTSVPANGATTSTVTVTLTDASADPVADKMVSLAQPGGKHSVISLPSGVSDGNGQVSFIVTDTTVESVTYTATDATDGVVLTPTASVSFTTPPSVPGAPGTPTAVAGNTQATVTWTAPTSNGGSPITSYTVTSTPGSHTCTWTTGPLSCTVTGLTNGTPYTFTVKATNAVGPSVASPTSNSVTPATVPGAPGTPTAVAGNTQATVTWTAPTSNGGSPITSYTVTSTPGSHTCTWTTGPLSCTVTGLTNGTPYTFTVKATNAVGPSVASPTSNSVTPAAGDSFHGLSPLRILDSRPGPGNVGGFTSPWGPASTRNVTVGGVGGVPADADAVVLNVTVTGATAGSFVSVFPAGAATPTVSDLNFTSGETIANQVTVKLGAGGQVSVLNFAGNVDILADVTGYYDTSSGDGFTSLTPARILDSRPGTGNTGGFNSPWGPGVSRDVSVGGLGGVPADADAVVLNVTVTGPTAGSFLSIWPQGSTRPTVSSLNFTAGETIPNAVTVKLNAANGKISVYNLTGNVDVIIDVAGYFQAGTGKLFHPLTPARILDSRPGVGNIGGFASPWGPGVTRSLAVTGAGGVPSGADSVVANVTATNSTADSYLTVFPQGASRPTASNVNWSAGETIANAVTVKLSAGGQISLYNLTGNVDVLTDIAGYYQ